MFVQYVAKPSLSPAILPGIEIFIEENSQTLPRLLLQRPRSRMVQLFEIGCNSYIHVIDLVFLGFLGFPP